MKSRWASWPGDPGPFPPALVRSPERGCSRPAQPGGPPLGSQGTWLPFLPPEHSFRKLQTRSDHTCTAHRGFPCHSANRALCAHSSPHLPARPPDAHACRLREAEAAGDPPTPKRTDPPSVRVAGPFSGQLDSHPEWGAEGSLDLRGLGAGFSRGAPPGERTSQRSSCAFAHGDRLRPRRPLPARRLPGSAPRGAVCAFKQRGAFRRFPAASVVAPWWPVRRGRLPARRAEPDGPTATPAQE